MGYSKADDQKVSVSRKKCKQSALARVFTATTLCLRNEYFQESLYGQNSWKSYKIDLCPNGNSLNILRPLCIYSEAALQKMSKIQRNQYLVSFVPQNSDKLAYVCSFVVQDTGKLGCSKCSSSKCIKYPEALSVNILVQNPWRPSNSLRC